ncbi:hypothetical protein CLV98_11311 [Dyadobacter jejuensis]|uniref:Replication restart DNA helicase PriA n=1 Tax=Dyadobacter jejuensis TaxID=1082580 RepID=A0A316ACQ3_9BACT|nr:hypothetical protein [Dyadobacter jejuensis]PWJ55535.1 hypothetical protein CLV98_11311 [Dyadobacter jejuensis]
MAEIQEFPCPNCGSELNFDSESIQLKCLHCHSKFPIETSTHIIEEKPIEELRKWFKSPNKELKQIAYACKKCGQTTFINNNEVFFECKDCGNNAMNTEAYGFNPISPSSIIPFSISKSEAQDAFTKWISKGFWYDSDLKDLSITDSLEGHYIPFWTFDANTYNQWSGEAGTYYFEQQAYTDSKGKRATRSVRKTRWRYRQGNFTHFFDDVLISGNDSISQNFVQQVYPYHLQELKPLNEKYILGWKAKSYEKSVEQCYHMAKEHMNGQIYNMSANYLKGDTYRNLRVNTNFTEESFKLIVLPLWLCTYLFKGKAYHFIINGQTGKIYGDKPLNKVKIGLAILLAILIIIAIAVLSKG